MADELGIVVKISKEFDIKLKEYMLELEKIGVKKTKADLVLYLAQIGLQQETKKDNGNTTKPKTGTKKTNCNSKGFAIRQLLQNQL